MSVQSHPDYPAEARHLFETLSWISRETAEAAERERLTRHQYEFIFKHSGGAFSDELMTAHVLFRRAARRLSSLTLAGRKPYFTRVDFQENGRDFPEIFYIGKYGVAPADTDEERIVDWRSPLANLYYAGQLGPVSYRAPDGRIKGELLLKRLLGIEDGELKTIFDTQIVSPDAYLQNVLGAYAGERLRDIVSTIQREQNDIIRADKNRPVIVQGAAGSGKTTVALHRIAYLLYRYRETMEPSNLMILAPNPLFLDYISAVLPELGVDDAIQTTYAGLCARLVEDLPPLSEDDTANLLMDPDIPPQKRETVERAARMRGSLEFRDELNAFIEKYVYDFVPAGDFRLGPVVAYTSEQAAKFFREDLAPFPLKRRLAEAKKHFKRRAKSALIAAVERLEAEVERRVEASRDRVPDEEFRRRAGELYRLREQQITRLKAESRKLGDAYLATLPKLDLMRIYREFLSDEKYACIREAAGEAHGKGRIRFEDLPAVLTLARSVCGWSERINLHHTVVDEAQDYSLFALWTLRQVTGTASFTLCGDLAQGIHGYRALLSWRQAAQRVFARDDPRIMYLNTSYRNTVEIMTEAAKVSARHPFEGQQPAEPVLRHGPKPDIRAFLASSALTDAIEKDIRAAAAEGMKTVGILTRTPARAKALHSSLKKRGTDAVLLKDGDAKYPGGAVVLPVTLAKGLEFDWVIVSDADSGQYGDNERDCRLLYVAMTRPLHRLSVYAKGRLSDLLTKADF